MKIDPLMVGHRESKEDVRAVQLVEIMSTAVVKAKTVPSCCAQHTGMHVVVVEALLIAICLPEERADTYRHKGIAVATILPFATHSAGPA